MTKRSLAYLIEAEMDKHSILFAAKDITNKLQQIAEQLAKMVANEIMPLGDAARDVFGPDEASAFEKALSDKINALTDQVRETKNAIADQIDSLESGQPASDLGDMDDTAGMFGGDTGADAGNDLGGAGDAEMFGDEDGAEGEAPAGDDLDLDDLFSGSPEEGNPAGRLQKESASHKGKIVEASADYQLTREFAGLVREGYTVSSVLDHLAESYAIDAATVAEIVKTVAASKKKA